MRRMSKSSRFVMVAAGLVALAAWTLSGAAADNEQLAFKWALVLEFLWRRLSPNPLGP